MGLLIDTVLLASGVVLWFRSNTEYDDVWRLFLRVIVCVDVLLVTVGHNQVLIESLLLALALALPTARRCFERSEP
jgi:hypothetical protein